MDGNGQVNEADFIADLAAMAAAIAGSGVTGGGSGSSSLVGNLVIPAWSATFTGDAGTIKGALNGGDVDWSVVSKFGGEGTSNAGLIVSYTFNSGTAAAPAAVNANAIVTAASKAGFAVSLVDNVGVANGLTTVQLSIVRSDQSAGWADTFGLLLTLLYN